jgi:hypothetical protein
MGLAIALPLAIFAAFNSFVGILGNERGRFSSVSVSDGEQATASLQSTAVMIDGRAKAFMSARDSAFLNLESGLNSATLSAGRAGDPSLTLRSDGVLYTIGIQDGKLVLFGSAEDGMKLSTRELMDPAKENGGWPD